MTRSILRISAVLAALGLTACGTASTQNGTAGSGARATAFIGFSKCMRANGVPSFPDPGGANGAGIRIQAGGPGGPAGTGSLDNQTITVNGVTVSGPAFRAAMQKCRGQLPNGGRPSAQRLAQIRKSALAMAQCMRDHGVTNFPDPQFRSGPGGRVGIGIGLGLRQVDTSSPTFLAAQKVCMQGRFGFGFRRRFG